MLNRSLFMDVDFWSIYVKYIWGFECLEMSVEVIFIVKKVMGY